MKGLDGMAQIDFQTDPGRYRHWKLRFDGPVAHLVMDVDPAPACSRATS
jgi:benzoyl-CoA-dihydrodiol lyase